MVPVEFLSDEQAVGFASFQGPPTHVQLEKYFFLDGTDPRGIINLAVVIGLEGRRHGTAAAKVGGNRDERRHHEHGC